MTSINTLTTFDEAAKTAISENLYNDSWRMTSFLIQTLVKLESYYTSLNEQNPDEDFYTAQIATSSALEMINVTYSVPTSDERFEDVQNLFDSTINLFIKDYSDDAIADVVLISSLAKYVAGMRVYCWSQVLEGGHITDETVEALKLAKRDEKAVELAVKAASEAIFTD